MSMPVSATVTSSLKEKFDNLDLKSTFAIVFSARKRVKPKVFYDFADFIKMPEKDLATLLNLSARTINNYKKSHRLLEPVYSEHLLKLIALYLKGEEIFGNVGEFNYWLQKPFWNSKKNERPLDWLITPGGVDLVGEELDRLAHSYPA
ncbi:MAG: DUF2384 domain-containing protein [Bacteroidetes bacterium]|nr:MAG: DUF2384 domain-containing protein [Bacteroidota bacterium]